ncbi:ABC-2 type transporter [Novipirellula galeiformis]|uniref:Transport permease protein n=1 Tax=Novipirellula galeiformis TaxID=2528004 RepID=A0A5C6CRD7_9BACT|nr:ABC-2 type transporter [Novipirellula galeiformis]
MSAITTSPSTSSDSVGQTNPTSVRAGMSAAWMLARREWTRFFRQRNRVSAAIVQPLLFWMLFGTGLRGAFTVAGDQNFMEFFLPGTVGLIVLFTAIFATISVIEDRREGFMQSVLVSPVGRWPVLMGKVIGGSAIAWVQAMFFLMLVYLFGTASLSSSIFLLMPLLALIAIGMCSLGMIVAWPMDSTQGFHAIMMLGLMPMWLLSGSFFPIPAWSDSTVGQMILGGIMRINPLSYSMLEMRRLIYPEVDFANAGFAPSSATCWSVTIIATIVVTLIAWRLVRGSRKVDVIV